MTISQRLDLDDSPHLDDVLLRSPLSSMYRAAQCDCSDQCAPSPAPAVSGLASVKYAFVERSPYSCVSTLEEGLCLSRRQHTFPSAYIKYACRKRVRLLPAKHTEYEPTRLAPSPRHATNRTRAVRSVRMAVMSSRLSAKDPYTKWVLMASRAERIATDPASIMFEMTKDVYSPARKEPSVLSGDTANSVLYSFHGDLTTGSYFVSHAHFFRTCFLRFFLLQKEQRIRRMLLSSPPCAVHATHAAGTACAEGLPNIAVPPCLLGLDESSAPTHLLKEALIAYLRAVMRPLCRRIVRALAMQAALRDLGALERASSINELCMRLARVYRDIATVEADKAAHAEKISELEASTAMLRERVNQRAVLLREQHEDHATLAASHKASLALLESEVMAYEDAFVRTQRQMAQMAPELGRLAEEVAVKSAERDNLKAQLTRARASLAALEAEASSVSKAQARRLKALAAQQQQNGNDEKRILRAHERELAALDQRLQDLPARWKADSKLLVSAIQGETGAADAVSVGRILSDLCSASAGEGGRAGSRKSPRVSAKQSPITHTFNVDDTQKHVMQVLEQHGLALPVDHAGPCDDTDASGADRKSVTAFVAERASPTGEEEAPDYVVKASKSVLRRVARVHSLRTIVTKAAPLLADRLCGARADNERRVCAIADKAALLRDLEQQSKSIAEQISRREKQACDASGGSAKVGGKKGRDAERVAAGSNAARSRADSFNVDYQGSIVRTDSRRSIAAESNGRAASKIMFTASPQPTAASSEKRFVFSDERPTDEQMTAPGSLTGSTRASLTASRMGKHANASAKDITSSLVKQSVEKSVIGKGRTRNKDALAEEPLQDADVLIPQAFSTGSLGLTRPPMGTGAFGDLTNGDLERGAPCVLPCLYSNKLFLDQFNSTTAENTRDPFCQMFVADSEIHRTVPLEKVFLGNPDDLANLMLVLYMRGSLYNDSSGSSTPISAEPDAPVQCNCSCNPFSSATTNEHQAKGYK